jgi:hypothetical protein
MAARAMAGQLVYDLNFDLVYGTAQWNVDLVIGAPPPGTSPPLDGVVRKASPSTVQVALEIKSVMTEHRKAVKNRKRDFEAHHEHVHNYSQQTVAAGLMVINAAAQFSSPLRADVTNHTNVLERVRHCLDEMRNVNMRGGPTGYGLDAKAVVVVDMDNIDLASTRFLERRPAPQIGDPMHYDAFIQRVCNEYRMRW